MLRPVRMAAAETDSRVPTSRSSNQSRSTDGAQKGAKTDPKPFTTENAMLCISITMPGRSWLTNFNELTLSASGTCFPLPQGALLEGHLVRGEPRSDDRTGGASDTSNVGGSVGIISHAIEQLHD